MGLVWLDFWTGPPHSCWSCAKWRRCSSWFVDGFCGGRKRVEIGAKLHMLALQRSTEWDNSPDGNVGVLELSWHLKQSYCSFTGSISSTYTKIRLPSPYQVCCNLSQKDASGWWGFSSFGQTPGKENVGYAAGYALFKRTHNQWLCVCLILTAASNQLS